MRLAIALPVVCIMLACTPSAPGRSPAPNTQPENAGAVTAMPNPVLPPIPLVTGALQPRVVYPNENQLIQSRDSNFIFGSLGNGKATLTINGAPVQVLANGSWIAFLHNPPDRQPAYNLVAALGADTVRFTRTVRLLPPQEPLSTSGALVVDSGSVTPNTRLSLADNDQVWVSVRAPANATVQWVGDSGLAAPLVSDAPIAGSYAGDPNQWATEIAARYLRAHTQLMITREADTVLLALPAVAMAPTTPTYGMLGAAPMSGPVVNDTDRVIIARPTAGGTYKWLLMPGTVVPITGANGDFVHIGLGHELGAWVKSEDVNTLPKGYAPPPRVAENARLLPVAGAVDLRIPMSRRPPFLVEESDHQITLTLYDTRANTDILQYVANDSTVREVSWNQVTSDRVRFTLRLASQPFGYLAFWDGNAFVLRVRRPPVVNAAKPLAGLVIAVDPGHPPIGATGPTGYYEADAVLAVGEKLRTILQQRGATVVMTRTTRAPVALGERPIIARRANAQALVSIHLNALPDGVNPFSTNGTGAYFFQPQSEPLARALQNDMVARMKLPNLGVYYDNLALARPTWMPAVLCEGAFIMMPDQEAALRTPEFQTAYARGIADGLENYFRGLGRGR